MLLVPLRRWHGARTAARRPRRPNRDYSELRPALCATHAKRLAHAAQTLLRGADHRSINAAAYRHLRDDRHPPQTRGRQIALRRTAVGDDRSNGAALAGLSEDFA